MFVVLSFFYVWKLSKIFLKKVPSESGYLTKPFPIELYDFTALGLGKTIVDGEKSLRFSPKYPDILSQYYSVKSTISNSQNKFYALNMLKGVNPIKSGESKNL